MGICVTVVFSMPGKTASSDDAQVTIETGGKLKGYTVKAKRRAVAQGTLSRSYTGLGSNPSLSPSLADFWLKDHGDVISPLSFNFLYNGTNDKNPL